MDPPSDMNYAGMGYAGLTVTSQPYFLNIIRKKRHCMTCIIPIPYLVSMVLVILRSYICTCH